MDGEGPPAGATREEAAYWLNVYTEILAMEEKVLRRVEQLMATQSVAARREVELTNVPVIVAQVERFRQRRGYWQARAAELDGQALDRTRSTINKDSTRKSSANPGKRARRKRSSTT